MTGTRVIGTGNTLFVSWITDSSVVTSGWSAVTGVYLDTTISAGTPINPPTYVNNMEIRYLIVGPTDCTVTLRFTSFGTNAADRVRVYDGTSASARLIGTYSGSLAAFSVNATSNNLYITWFTDAASAPSTGWTATTGIYLVKSYFAGTPIVPPPITPNMVVQYFITGPRNMLMALGMSYFDVAPPTVVTVYDSATISGTARHQNLTCVRPCLDTSSVVFTSTNNSLVVIYTTGTSVVGTGWSGIPSVLGPTGPIGE